MEKLTQLLNEPDKKPPSLSTARKEELQQMVLELGGDPGAMTVMQLREYVKHLQGRPTQVKDPLEKGLPKMKKEELARVAVAKGINPMGKTVDQLRLAISGWKPPPINSATRRVTVPTRTGASTNVSAGSAQEEFSCPECRQPMDSVNNGLETYWTCPSVGCPQYTVAANENMPGMASDDQTFSWYQPPEDMEEELL